MANSNLIVLSIGLGIVGLLMIGGAYLSFSDAFESFEEDEVDCSSIEWYPEMKGGCSPTGDFGCCSCLFGLVLVGLVVGSLVSGTVTGVVGATLETPDVVVVGAPLPPPAPPVGMVKDEFGDLERELESLEG